MYNNCNINELIGKTLVDIQGMEKNSGEIIFICNDSSRYMMYHEQDCCEWVELEDVCGNVTALLNSPITMAEERTSYDNDEWGDHITWTFYTFATVKGYVDLRWFGTSNGYYSESVDFVKIE